MQPQQIVTSMPPLDIIVAVKGDEVTVELDVRNNADVRVGDQYTAQWPDGAITIMRVTGFKSAEDYSDTIARRADTMREGVAGVPESLTARKAYQIKLALMRVEGELLPGGGRIVGAARMPDTMLPVQRIHDDTLEQFVVNADGNLILGNLRSGSRTLRRVARISQNYAGERMVVLGMPGKGKTQLLRSLLSQAMADEMRGDDNAVVAVGGASFGLDEGGFIYPNDDEIPPLDDADVPPEQDDYPASADQLTFVEWEEGEVDE